MERPRRAASALRRASRSGGRSRVSVIIVSPWLQYRKPVGLRQRTHAGESASKGLGLLILKSAPLGYNAVVAKRKNPMAWGLAAILALILLGGVGPPVLLWWQAYRLARYHGHGADLH